MKDGIYFEVFAMKNGIRYNTKIIDVKEANRILITCTMNGFEKIIGLEETALPTEKGGVE
jgi:hypothetical protein